jgi:hypothetical protein
MENKQEYFEFLNVLRESGKINMFGAAPYLQETFGLKRYEARDIVIEWMENFKSVGVE